MTCAVHPELQRELLTAQSLGSNPETCFRTVVKWIETRCSSQAGSLSPSLQGLMELIRSTARVRPAWLLQELVAMSGQPALLGLLLAHCLSWNVVTAQELLSLPAAPSLLAAALVELHAALAVPSTDPPSQQQSSTTANTQRAFGTLVQLMVTASELEGCKRATEDAARLLRAQWGAATSSSSSSSSSRGSRGSGFGGQDQPPTAEAGLGLECGVQLLARLVGVVHREVFPRSLATRWLEGELTAALQPPTTPAKQQQQQQQQQQQGGGPGGARQLEAGDTSGPAWSDAMAAFAAALPLPNLLAHVLRALLSSSNGGRSGGSAPGATPQHLDRCAQLLASAAAASGHAAADVSGWVSSQAVAGLQQREVALVWGALQLKRRLCASPREYEGWLGGSSLAGEAGAQRNLQFLVQSVFIPMLPEESDAAMLGAQVHALAGLADLSTSATRLVQEYRSAAQQRQHALQQQQQQQEGGGAAALSGAGAAAGGAALSGPAAANLERAQVQAELLLCEFQLSSPGRLSPGTLQDLAARAANTFQKGAVINQLVPALLRPTAEPGGVEARVALLEHMFKELPTGAGASVLRPHFKPQAVQRFRQACQLAQLESVALPQLSAALVEAMGASAGRGGLAGGPSPHQLLDRLERLVDEEVKACGGSAAATGLQGLLSSLLNTFHAAYASCLASPTPGRACLGLAVHLLRTIHAHRELHGVLLGRVEELVLVAGPAGQLDAQQALSLSMLVVVMGALLAAQPPDMQQQQSPPVSLFTWQPGSISSLPVGASSAPPAAAAAAEVGGSDWLRQLLARLPLRRAGHMLWACRFTAALLSCLRHYSCFVVLGPSAGPSTAAAAGGAGFTGSGSARQLGPLVRLHGSGVGPGKVGSYDGEWLRRLAYPLCPAAVRLLQWLQLRVGVADMLAPKASFITSASAALGQAGRPGGMGSGTEEGRLGKRPRLQQGQPEGRVVQAGAAEGLAAAEGGEDARHAQQLCQAVLGGELGQGLVQEAGPLPLATFLQLEAAAAAGSVDSTSSSTATTNTTSSDSGSSDLVPPVGRDAMIRAVCSEFLRLYLPQAPSGTAAAQPAQPPQDLPPLQPLLASGAVGQGKGLAHGAEQAADLDCLADTQPLDEDFDGAVMATECVPDSQEGEEDGWGEAAAAAAPAAAAPTGGIGSSDGGGMVPDAGRAVASGLHCRLARAAGEAVAAAVIWWAGDAGGGPDAQGTSAGVGRGGGAILAVLQAAAAHLLRLLLAHGGDGSGSTASSRAATLAHFLLGVIRGCQQGLPASVAVLGDWVTGGLRLNIRGSAEAAAGPVLQFEEGAVQRAAALIGPLCRGLLLELLPGPLFEDGLNSAAAKVEGCVQSVFRGLEDATLPDAQLLGDLGQVLSA